MMFRLRTHKCIIPQREFQSLGKSLLFWSDGNPMEPTDKRRTQKKQTKKPYDKPAFRFERVFETQALSCGKIGGTSTQCKLSRKTS